MGGLIIPTWTGRQQTFYQLWLDDYYGSPLEFLDMILGGSVQRTLNDIGKVEVALPGDFDERLTVVDLMIEVWRAPAGGNLMLETVGFVQDTDLADDEEGNEVTIVSCDDPNCLLDAKLVAYPAGTAYAKKSGPADDLMKAVVRENLGSLATDTARDLSSLDFTVQPDFGLGPTVSLSFAHKTVLEALQKIADAAREKGTLVFFDVVPVLIDNRIGFDFRTYIGQRGQDRTYASGTPTVFGKQWGNLKNARLKKTFRNERNAIYAGGSAQGEEREIIPVLDASRIGRSPWRRRELFVNGSNLDTDELTDKAEAELAAHRPARKFSGTLLDGDQALYGLDWGFGDLVVVEHRSEQFDAMVKVTKIEWSPDDDDRIDAKIEVDL